MEFITFGIIPGLIVAIKRLRGKKPSSEANVKETSNNATSEARNSTTSSV
jgi:hypothetical protein